MNLNLVRQAAKTVFLISTGTKYLKPLATDLRFNRFDFWVTNMVNCLECRISDAILCLNDKLKLLRRYYLFPRVTIEFRFVKLKGF